MDISASLTYHITKTGNVLRQLAAKRLKDAGLDITPEESVLLNQLWDQDNQSVSQLGKWTVKGPSTLTRQIDGLAKKGYVERWHGSQDRRMVFVRLSEKGKALRGTFDKTGIRELDSDVVRMPAKDAERFLALLLQIRSNALKEIESLTRSKT